LKNAGFVPISLKLSKKNFNSLAGFLAVADWLGTLRVAKDIGLPEVIFEFWTFFW